MYKHHKHEDGMVTLLTAVILMLAVFGISYFTSDVVIHEKQLVANDYRAAQALNAAMAGMDQAIAYLVNENTPLLAASTATTSSGRFSYTMSSAASDAIVSIVSDGWSEDESVHRTLTQTFGQLPVSPLFQNAPNVPVLALGNADMTGNLTITNNVTDITIWVGDEVANWGNGKTKIKVDDKPSQLSSTKNGRGPDVLEKDLNLAVLGEDGLVENLFGSKYPTWQSLEDAFNPGGLNPDGQPQGTDCQDGGVLHYSGDLTLNNDDYGVNKQCILIVDGEFQFGNGVFNGLILARKIEKGNGSPTINGAVVVTQNFGGDPDDPSTKVAGNPEIIFTEIDADIPDPNAGFSGFGFVTSSWKDW